MPTKLIFVLLIFTGCSVNHVFLDFRPCNISECQIDKVKAGLKEDFAQFRFKYSQTNPNRPYYHLIFTDGNPEMEIYGLAFSDTRTAYIYTNAIQITCSDWYPEDFNEVSTAQGIANVAAHELGHLIGFEHISDSIQDDLMTAHSYKEYLCYYNGGWVIKQKRRF